MRFVETPVFTSSVTRWLDDESYRQLQLALMLRPEQGPVIPGAGGLRKVRWARAGGGKRGGLRIIYYWAPRDAAFYMLFAYAKNDQGDLTPAQTKALGRLVREEFK
jgi:hypothetical protein